MPFKFMTKKEEKAFEILKAKGVKVTREKFSEWCMGKKCYFSSSAGCLWHPTPKEMASEYLSEIGWNEK